MLEAAYAKDLSFYIVAPNLSVNATTLRPCEAEVSKALQAYTGYKTNTQSLIDEARDYNFSMRMENRSLDEKGSTQVNDLNEQERENLVNNRWYERRDESTLDDKTHDAKFHKQLVALLEITETIKQNRTNTTVFLIAAVALETQPGMVSPSLALLAVMAQDLARRNEEEPNQTYQTLQQLLREPLNYVAERQGISFPVLLYIISPL